MEETQTEKKIAFIKEEIKKLFSNVEGSHDFYHIERVVRLSNYIAEREKADKNKTTIIALIHEVEDKKIGVLTKDKALKLLEGIKHKTLLLEEALSISWSKGKVPKTLEGKIVQDADRLDAIGAIGIARAFSYGGFRRRKLYDPTSLKAEGSINHIFQKLLKIKDKLNTNTAKQIAERRHRFMINFLEEFMSEWYFKGGEIYD